MKQYAIGVDFGTLSARAVAMDTETGHIAGTSESNFAHGVITGMMPDGTKLPADWALQIPKDYVDALYGAVSDLMRSTGLRAEQIVGLGIDVTASTMLPVTASGMPLCEKNQFKNDPNAYVKLWKHHGASKYAKGIARVAKERGEAWLKNCGGDISSEHFLPKALQIYTEAPAVFHAAERLVEVGDWLVSLITGSESRNYCAAAYKTYYMDGKDISAGFLEEITPGFSELLTKGYSNFAHPGDRAGVLTAVAASHMGLLRGTPVAVAGVDAHVTALGCGVSGPGIMLMVIGTSSCEMVMDKQEREIPGICGVVKDGICPDLFAYEAGQSGVGDMFAWFAGNNVPPAYHKEAESRGISIQRLLTEKAERLKPGENGLIALDWWSGVRSILMDYELSGVMLGQTLATTPEEQYRAMLESTAFGAKLIIDTFEAGGVQVNSIYATGGIPLKNHLMMQIYADVTGRDVHVIKRTNAVAAGSAVLGMAAGIGQGFADVGRIAACFPAEEELVRPIEKNVQIYARMYEVYAQMYHCLSAKNSVLRELNAIRAAAKRGN